MQEVLFLHGQQHAFCSLLLFVHFPCIMLRNSYLYIWLYFFPNGGEKTPQCSTLVLNAMIIYTPPLPPPTEKTTILNSTAPNIRIYQFYVNGCFINVTIPQLLKNHGLMLFFPHSLNSNMGWFDQIFSCQLVGGCMHMLLPTGFYVCVSCLFIKDYIWNQVEA